MNRMCKILLVLIISLVASTAFAVEWTPLQLSLVNPVQLFPEETKVYGIRGNLIYGANKEMNGIDYGPINHTKGVTNGVQLGAAPFGGINITEELNGLQIVGIFGGGNISSGETKGLQISGLFGGVNYAGNVDGVQISGVWGGLNVADNLNGVQIAGILAGVNIAKDTNGLQLATIYNQADSMSGLQLGLVNNCRKMRGVQIGLLNIIRDSALPFFPVINASF